MAAYTSFISILGAADKGAGDTTCPAAKGLYVMAGQFAGAMMTNGYDASPPPADRPQKLKIANELLMNAELTCNTQVKDAGSKPKPPGPKPPGPKPPGSEVPTEAGLSIPVMGAIALGAWYLLFRRVK